jgi:hypothetical protein
VLDGLVQLFKLGMAERIAILLGMEFGMIQNLIADPVPDAGDVGLI